MTLISDLESYFSISTPHLSCERYRLATQQMQSHWLCLFTITVSRALAAQLYKLIIVSRKKQQSIYSSRGQWCPFFSVII